MNTSHKRAAFTTLGCKLNIAETSRIAHEFEQAGYTRVDIGQPADVYVVNTCTVTDNADRKSRKLIRQIHRRAPDATIVVTGCYAQLDAAALKDLPGVRLISGNEEKFSLVQYVENDPPNGTPRILPASESDLIRFQSAHTIQDHTRTFVKIQDGCDYGCTYCTIPRARGRSRSDSIHETVNRIRKLAVTGVREIILSGINLGDFGRPSGERLLDLVRELDKLDGIRRFRISSIEPNLLSDELISFVADSRRFLPHFHIPLQSGSDELLKKMRRRYLTDLYRDRVDKIHHILPDACIAADVITGFPGETETLFQASFDFIRSLNISYLHVFPFSERKGTPAAEMTPVVPVGVRQERSRILQQYSRTQHRRFEDAFLGSVRPVLVEQIHDGLAVGHTDNFIKCGIPGENIGINQICNVQLNRRGNQFLLGEVAA